MKTIMLGITLVLGTLTAACGGGMADKAVGYYEDCAKCADEACAKDVAKKMAKWQASLSLEDVAKVSESDMKKLEAAELKCSKKYNDFGMWVID